MRDRWRSTGPRQLQIRGLESSRAQNGTRDPERRFLNGALMAKHLEMGIVNPVQLSLKTPVSLRQNRSESTPGQETGSAIPQQGGNTARGPQPGAKSSRPTRVDPGLAAHLRPLPVAVSSLWAAGRIPPDVSRRCGVPGQESLMSCGTDRFHVKRKHYGELVETVGGQEG